MKIYTKGVTHSGRFHADDVLSTALLRLLCPTFTVTRTNVPPTSEAADVIVYDTGGGRFDHHQPDAPVRENGVKYASFGLLWSEYGEELCGSAEAAARIESMLVCPVDDADNGGRRNTLSDVLTAFNPVYDSTENSDEAFERAVSIAHSILERVILTEKKKSEAHDELLASCAKMQYRTVVLERFVPWDSVLPTTEALFVVYPSLRGGWNLQCVPELPKGSTVKLLLPEKWRGREGAELFEVTGIKGLIFCHNSGFLASAETVDDAVAAAKAAQEEAVSMGNIQG